MDFSFTEEQSMLRDTVASFLADKYDFDTRRSILKSEAGWRPDYWKAFAEELGILGAPFPDDLGGLGGGAIEKHGRHGSVRPRAGRRALSGGRW